ncbi:hypothetical protein FQN49_004727 [Arthroderma sp. PD_2]|nr:hypothetical protein FQN49_004727 [Arthroderma sp. PD_2]
MNVHRKVQRKRKSREYQIVKSFKKFRRANVPPLPSRRKRALSIDDSGQEQKGGKKKQLVHNQAQSPFFQLPLEIRLIIYEYAVGIGKVHIVHTARRKLASFPCTSNAEVVGDDGNPDTQPCDCVSMRVRYARRQREGIEREDILGPVVCNRSGISALPFLRSCRKVYTEAIDLLYSKRTFSFEQPYAFYAMAHSILPRRLRLVSSIEIIPWDWNVFYDDCRWQTPRESTLTKQYFNAAETPHNTWEVVCDTLAKKMDGLKHLRLRVYSRLRRTLSSCEPYPSYREATEIMCRPMYQIRGVETFEVIVCWSVTWSMQENPPFKLITPICQAPVDVEQQQV